MPRSSLLLAPSRSSVAVALTAALLLAGCAAGRSAPPAAALPGVSPGRLDADARTAALNTRLLARASALTAGEELPLGPGDLLEVSVFEVEELSGLRVRVPLGGAVTLPLIGEVPAAGSTPADLQAAIRRRLQARYIYDPQVSVLVVEQKSQRISVIGAVRKGGVYPLSSRLRLADALALAEGLADDADHVVYLSRRVVTQATPLAQAGDGAAPAARSGATETAPTLTVAIDLEALAQGRDELNVPLESGDVLHVPRAGSYYVGGAVERPGSFLLKSQTTLQGAIAAAGGVKGVADWSDIRIYRTRPEGEREVLEFDLAAIEKGARPPEIRKNDVIVVGRSAAKAFFFGIADFFQGIFGVSKGI